METLKKIYYYVYYRIFCFGKSLSDDALNDWKPLIIICLLQLFLIISIDLWLKILFGRSYILEKSNLQLWMICVGLVLINFYFLLWQNKWKSRTKEFIKHSRKKHLIGTVAVVALIIGVILLLFYSFYRFSQIKN
jgi:uncharacterized protein YacL